MASEEEECQHLERASRLWADGSSGREGVRRLDVPGELPPSSLGSRQDWHGTYDEVGRVVLVTGLSTVVVGLAI
jgi:hypothetical protein